MAHHMSVNSILLLGRCKNLKQPIGSLVAVKLVTRTIIAVHSLSQTIISFLCITGILNFNTERII